LQPIRVGIVGLGKIALEEHVPALQANAAFELVACASAKTSLPDVASFPSMEKMLDGCPGLDAVAICTPPQAHFEAAREALARGKHVLLEKPPCPTVAEFDELTALAEKSRRTLFQTWHARESSAVERAVQWMERRTVRRGRVVWKEDVRQWHPGQSWIWQDGGFGVLDAGINAISILTRLLPEPLDVDFAHLLVPENCVSPIAASAAFRTRSGAVIDAEFDFRHRGDQERAMEIDTDDGTLTLAWHGAVPSGTGSGMTVELGTQKEEYTSLYVRFADLIARGVSETDKRPLELVTQILAAAGRSAVAPFSE
jgi:Predicted dehydrogenases and related proteins